MKQKYSTGGKNIIDIKVSNNVSQLMKRNNTPSVIIAALLDIAASTCSELLSGRQSWRIAHLALIAQYYSVSIDEIVFSDSDYIKKNKSKDINKLRSQIREYLIQNNKYKTLGELEAAGYFNQIK